MKRLFVITALLAGLVIGISPAANAAPSGPPIPTPPNFTAVCGSGATAFTVTGVVTGKYKVITAPDGRVIVTSPDLRATLTANGKTLNYVLTGVVYYTFLDDRIEVIGTGLNLVTLPAIPFSPRPYAGLFLLTGNFNWALGLDWQTEVRPFSGVGQVIDVCALLS